MRTIQVRPSQNPRWQKQGGWEAFEPEGVCPVYCGPNAREEALSYARQRAGYGRAEIQVLDEAWDVAEISTTRIRGRWFKAGFDIRADNNDERIAVSISSFALF